MGASRYEELYINWLNQYPDSSSVEKVKILKHLTSSFDGEVIERSEISLDLFSSYKVCSTIK